MPVNLLGRLDRHIVVEMQRFGCLWNSAVEPLRGSPDLWQYSRVSPVHVQERPRLQCGRSEMRELIDARHLRARCTGLLLSGVYVNLPEWTVQRYCLLSKRGWDDLSVEHEPSDVYCRGQRLSRLLHLALYSVQRSGRLGVVLHECMHGRSGTVSIGNDPSVVCPR